MVAITKYFQYTVQTKTVMNLHFSDCRNSSNTGLNGPTVSFTLLLRAQSLDYSTHEESFSVLIQKAVRVREAEIKMKTHSFPFMTQFLL